MIFRSETWIKSVFVFALGFVLLVGLTYASMPGTPQIKSDEKSKVSGSIVARSGDLVQVKDKKTGQLVVVNERRGRSNSFATKTWMSRRWYRV